MMHIIPWCNIYVNVEKMGTISLEFDFEDLGHEFRLYSNIAGSQSNIVTDGTYSYKFAQSIDGNFVLFV